MSTTSRWRSSGRSSSRAARRPRPQLHVARTVTRRAERSAWAAIDEHGDTMNVLTAKYLNRLSDLLFILARYANREAGDVLWVPGGERSGDAPSVTPSRCRSWRHRCWCWRSRSGRSHDSDDGDEHRRDDALDHDETLSLERGGLVPPARTILPARAVNVNAGQSTLLTLCPGGDESSQASRPVSALGLMAI